MAKFYHNLQEFSDDLYKDISWRKHELRFLHNVIPENISKKQQAFLRMSIPILYAHWEGYVNNVSCNYLKYVKSKKLKYIDLKAQFITLSLKHKLNLHEALNIESQTEMVNFILKNLNEKSNIPYKNIIKTKANLTFKVFEEILFLLGIEKQKFLKYQSIIDDLVELRNYIAHGENKIVEKDTFFLFYNEVISLMDFFKTEIENSAATENFRINYLQYIAYNG
ncbi:MAG: hypothetical protein JXA16_11895 [Bacteroidales bacterium]|nr:hypothetical protein [Bacteroidales bacterium]